MLRDDHWDVLDQIVTGHPGVDPVFESMISIARQHFAGLKVSFSLLDRSGADFRARFEDELVRIPRVHAICNRTIAGSGVLVIEDARADAGLSALAIVSDRAGVRFYAGAPIRVNDEPVGVLSVCDGAPRTAFDANARERLAALAGALAHGLRVRFDLADALALKRAARVGSRKLDLTEALAGVGHWRLDVASGEVEWSTQVYRIHGVAPAEFNPRLGGALQFYIEEDRASVEAHILHAIRTVQGCAFDATIRRASDGERRKVMCKADVEVVDGVVRTVFGVFQDITERHRLLEQVTQDRERYRIITANATDVIAAYRPNAVFTYVSPASQSMLGYPPEALVGTKTFDIIHPDDHAEVRARFEHLVAGGPASTSSRIEYRALRADGSMIWVEAHPRAIYDADGRLEGFQDVARDVTARKALEAELVAAREAAEAATRAKSDFLANMSHELRTPLNSIVGFSGLIADAPELMPETARRASLVRGASHALVKIVDDILEFAKFEAEGVTLRAEPVELDRLLATALELVRDEATRKGLELSLDLARTGPPVLVDPSRLQQVVLNLLGNAVKFTRRGGVALQLADDAAGCIRISVRDTGVGIPKARLEAVFERFAQADPSTSRRFGGTGLGLAISRTLVEAFGGELGVESVEGVGSTFWFTFNPPIADATCAPRPPPPVGVEATRLDCRLLLVDDNDINRDLFCALLAGRGIEITQVGDGALAVQAVERQVFDAVLMDVQMPVMDGLEATRRIRAMGLVDLPIIALTANVMEHQIASSRAAGMNDHLSKPYTSRQVVELLGRWTVGGGGDARTDADRALRRSRLAGLEDSLGHSALDGFLSRLADQLRGMARLLTAPDVDTEVLGHRAHSVRGLAGTLGFVEVATQYAAVETACLEADELDDVRRRALQATTESLAEIALRRAA